MSDIGDMRARSDEERPQARWRARAVVPALLCAALGGALSCFGDCPPATSPTPLPPPPTLRPRYVLVRVANQALPAVLAESATLRVRLLADTLLFTVTAADSSRGTYSEIVVLGTRDASGAEVVSRTASAAREWTRPQNAAITLPAFSGGGATMRADATPFELGAGTAAPSQLTVFTQDGRTFVYEAR